MDLVTSWCPLTTDEQDTVSTGFADHSVEQGAPAYDKRRIKITASDSHGRLLAALTGDVLWDWLYIDELWVDPTARQQKLGQRLMTQAEALAQSEKLTGLWLWTQSWQAGGFYRRLGFEEFTRFEHFPRGHTRIGFRKYLAS